MAGYNRNFLIAMGILAAYVAAQNILSFSLPLLALDVSGAGTGLALINGAGFIPNILLAVFVGVINDRLRKSAGFRIYTAGLALATILLWIALLVGFISIPALMLFMIVFNAVGYALSNMQLTLIRLVVAQDRLADATALTSAVHSTVTTVGPAISGVLLFYLGHTSLVGVIAVMLLMASLASYAVQPEETLPAPTPFLEALATGWKAFRCNRDLVMMTIAVVLTNAAAGAFTVAILLKLTTELGANEMEIGFVLGLGGVGGVIGSAFAARIRRYLGRRLSFYLPIWLLATLYIIAALAPNIYLLAAIYFVEGAVSLFFAISIWAYRQESVQSAHMGRVAGITGAIFKIGMPPIMFLAGWLADQDSLMTVFWLATALKIVGALFLSFVAKWGWPKRQPL